VPAAPQRSAPLHRAPEAVAQLLHVAADRGVSRARLALHPQELGGIEVQLSVTAQGLTAKLVADSPEAARMLAQAGDDLRRSLEARDVNLISLEVSTSGEERRETAAGTFTGDGDGASPQTSPSPSDAGTAESAADADLPLPATLELPDGLLVDVLA
jgi:flagellar hook-length control protein FliK